MSAFAGIFFVAMFRIRAASKRQSRTKKAFENIAGFSPDYQFASFYSKTGIAIDKEQKKVAFSTENNDIKTYHFSKINSVRAEINDQEITKTNRGSQLVGAAAGGILLGGAGALVGALSGSKNQQIKLAKVKLQITVNDLDTPFYEIIFYDDTPVKKEGIVAQDALKDADTWLHRLNVVIVD